MNRHRIIAVTAWALTACWLAAMVALLWPYNAVTFPKGNVATVRPSTVGENGTVVVTFPAYCNNGQEVTVTRWADIYAPDGMRLASEQLGTLTFYPRPGGPVCFEPRTDTVKLSDAFVAYADEGTVYRIRTETAYRPNWIRTVVVEATTEPFTVTAN